MKADQYTKSISTLVDNDFRLKKNEEFVVSTINELKDKLSQLISYLMEKDFERLLQAMYRLDIDEKKFWIILEGSEREKISLELADLVIQRELKKLETRQKYKH